MRILLVGNGIEIRYNPSMTISSIVEAMNKGESSVRAINIENNLSGFYKNNLEEQYGNIELKHDDFVKISSVINDDIKGLSVEQIFNKISELLMDPEKIKNLKLIFLSYIDGMSDKTPINASEKLRRTLCDYDIILTTNYTHLLERILAPVGDDAPNIVHLHGDYKRDKENVLLGLEKENNKSTTELRERKELENFSDVFLSHKWFINDKEKISVDVFGMSFKNDENILGNIYRWIMSKIFSKNIAELNETNGIYDNESSLSSAARQMFVLNYYWHDIPDKRAFDEISDWANNIFEFLPYSENDPHRGSMLMLLCAIWNKKFDQISETLLTTRFKEKYLIHEGMTISVRCSNKSDDNFVRDDSGKPVLRF